MRRDLGDGGTGVQDRVRYVLCARCRAGHEDPRDVRASGIDVLVRLGNVVVVVQFDGVITGEKTLDLAVGLDADRQYDHVVFGFDDRPAVLDVLVPQYQVAVGFLGDLCDAALDVCRAHRLGAFVELVVALAGGTDVHVVDGDFGQRQRAHDQLVLLDRVHAAEPRAERVVDPASTVRSRRLVAGAGAEDVGDPLRDLAVAGPKDRVEGSGRGQEPVHLHARDYVLVAAETVPGLGVGGEELVARGHNDGPDIDIFNLLAHVEMDGVGRADCHALATLGADAAVQAVTGGGSCFGLGQRRLDLGPSGPGRMALGERPLEAVLRRVGGFRGSAN